MPLLPRLFSVLVVLTLFGCSENSKTNTSDTAKTTSPSTERTADYDAANNAYFGDLHIHTSWSFDAFIYNTRTTPDDAYKYGKGEKIAHSATDGIQLRRPLDFMAVTDHAEYMGVMKKMLEPEHPFYNLDIAKQIRSTDGPTSLGAFASVGRSIAGNLPFKELDQKDIKTSTWEEIVKIANAHYEPGKFTTFPAYEWTSSPGDTMDINGGRIPMARNMHRNVIFKGDKVPALPFSSFDSQNPEKLWDWMDMQRKNGVTLLAIPHNANMSDGLMYAQTQYEGSPMTLQYIRQRMRNEPINEVVQIKGQSMSHPILAPNDEFADFELFAYTFTMTTPTPSKAPGSYVREAYQNGLAIEKQIGANPFKFGMIGSSDGHNSAGALEEDNYFGKFGIRDGTPSQRLDNKQRRFLSNKFMSAAGMAGVWASENTREAIFAAMERKETFATSGPRIKLRIFGGWDFKKEDLEKDDWTKEAYSKGIPMGGDLKVRSEELRGKNASPSFLIWAVKDSESANLDRIQVIKAWVNADGQAQEKIFDVAWSGERAIGANGKLPPVGNTVNTAEATYDNSIGAVSLQTVWEDPEFDASQSAMYYLRVLEIPTPRWSTYDAKALGISIPDDLNATIQERAWSSPIWYTK